MVEAMLGVWLFLLAAAAGFLCGRHDRRRGQPEKRRTRAPSETVDMSWQELLRFLQYDGSDSSERERERSVTENEADSGRNTERIHPRRPL